MTCGCGDAYAGLIWGIPVHGCPRTACLTSREHSAHFTPAPCSDFSTELLQNMTGWNAYWQSFLQYMTDEGGGEGSYAHQWASDFVMSIRAQGCSLLSEHADVHAAFCSGREYASLRSFCPKSCGCSNSPFASPECPRACSHLGTGPEEPPSLRLGKTKNSLWLTVPPPLRAQLLKVAP